MGLYDLKSGQLIRQYDFTFSVRYSDLVLVDPVDPLERYLVSPGEIREIDTGRTLLMYPGKDFYLFSSCGDELLLKYGRSYSILETKTGRLVGQLPQDFIPFALSSGGTHCVGLSENHEDIVVLDTATGEMRETGIPKKQVVYATYSFDNKWLIFAHVIYSGQDLKGYHFPVTLIQADSFASPRRIGGFNNFRGIRPTQNGDFIISGTILGSRLELRRNFNNYDHVQYRFKPSLAKSPLEEIVVNGTIQMDFDLEKMIGVSTDSKRRTHVVDLKTGKSLYCIDNSDIGKLFRKISSFPKSPIFGIIMVSIICISAAVIIKRRSHRKAQETDQSDLS